MFAFKLWGNFGVFRDPITITQNVSFSIPPKTTIGGVLAAILGIDYNEYFNDPGYFFFKYSLILQNPIRKQSFSQNYIEDYTIKSHLKHDSMKKIIGDQLEFDNYWEKFRRKMPKPKPIKRELLINPSYIIFIEEFKYEKQIIEDLKHHNTGFAIYMGNTEFAANYQFIKCHKIYETDADCLDSFTTSQENIRFETHKKYTTVYTATKVVNERKYRDFKKITISHNGISLNKPQKAYLIQTSEGEFYCEFI